MAAIDFDLSDLVCAGCLRRLTQNAVNAFTRVATHGTPGEQLAAWQERQVQGRGKLAFVRAMVQFRLVHRLLYHHHINLGVVVQSGAQGKAPVMHAHTTLVWAETLERFIRFYEQNRYGELLVEEWGELAFDVRAIQPAYTTRCAVASRPLCRAP